MSLNHQLGNDAAISYVLMLNSELSEAGQVFKAGAFQINSSPTGIHLLSH